MSELVLILAREASPMARQLHKIFSKLGETYLVSDRPYQKFDESIPWHPTKQLEGYAGLMGGKHFSNITAWSRAFYFLDSLPRIPEGVWFVEEDVAGAPDRFANLFKQTAKIGADLSAPAIRDRSNIPAWPFWQKAEEHFEVPMRSYQPLCRLSCDLVKAVLKFREDHGSFCFHEVLFASVAYRDNLTLLDWRLDWSCHRLFSQFCFRPQVNHLDGGISHPVKDKITHLALSLLTFTPPVNTNDIFLEYQKKLNEFPSLSVLGKISKPYLYWYSVWLTTQNPILVLSLGIRCSSLAFYTVCHLVKNSGSRLVLLQEEEPDDLSDADFHHSISFDSSLIDNVELLDGNLVEACAHLVISEDYWEKVDLVLADPALPLVQFSTVVLQMWHLLKPGGVLAFLPDSGDHSGRIEKCLSGGYNRVESPPGGPIFFMKQAPDDSDGRPVFGQLANLPVSNLSSQSTTKIAPASSNLTSTTTVQVLEHARISFCTTCKGRLADVRQNLPHTLKNMEREDQLVLLDFDSTDGLAAWIHEHHLADIHSGRLKFAELIEGPADWHPTRAKNIAHRLATKEIVCNLDADNWVEEGFSSWLRQALAGVPQGVTCPGLEWHGGGGGRVAMRARIFRFLRGYDERIRGWGWDDDDLIIRAKAVGCCSIDLPSQFATFEKHDSDDRVFHEGASTKGECLAINRKITAETIKTGNFRVNGETTWGAAHLRLNFKTNLTLGSSS